MFRFLLYFSILSPFLGLTQQQIKGVFSPKDSFKVVMLYQLNQGNATYVSYAMINKNGEIQIDLDASVPTGQYRLVYALPQSEYNFEFIYTGTEDIVFNFDAKNGVEFINSKENQLLHSYQQLITVAQNELVQLYTKSTLDTLIYSHQVQKLDSIQNSYERLSKGTIAAHFIKASKLYTPLNVETSKAYVSHVKTHYFDAIDFLDPVLQNSNFILGKCIDYILRIHLSETPSLQDYQSNVDAVYQVLATTKPSDQLTTLINLKEALMASGHDTLSVYLTKTYLLPLARQLNHTELIPTLEAFLRIAVGEKAPNFNIENFSEISKQSLYDLEDANTYLLIFWSSDCGHCLNELPDIHAYILSHPEKKISVVAIGIEKNTAQWTKTIAPWSAFIHSIAEGKWEHEITKSYDIQATPTYFVLDASKVITDKPFSLNDLKNVLDQK